MTYHDEEQTQAILQGNKKAFETFFCSLYSRLKVNTQQRTHSLGHSVYFPDGKKQSPQA